VAWWWGGGVPWAGLCCALPLCLVFVRVAFVRVGRPVGAVGWAVAWLGGVAVVVLGPGFCRRGWCGVPVLLARCGVGRLSAGVGCCGFGALVCVVLGFVGVVVGGPVCVPGVASAWVVSAVGVVGVAFARCVWGWCFWVVGVFRGCASLFILSWLGFVRLAIRPQMTNVILIA